MPVESGAYTTLAKVKVHLGITDSTYDDLLTQLINASYRCIDNYIGHHMKANDYVEYIDGDGTNEIIAKEYPINSVASIYDDPDRDFDSSTLIDSGDYVILSDEGVIRQFGTGGSFSVGTQNVKLSYNAGYATIPADAEQASISHVAWMFKRAGTEGLTTATLGGRTETYEGDSLPVHIRTMINHYKTWHT